MGWAAAAVAVVGVAFQGASHNQAKKKERNQREASLTNERQKDVTTIREKRRLLRETRIREADIRVSAEHSNVKGSSSESQALSNVRTQLVDNLGFMSGSNDRADRISHFNQKAADADARSKIFGNLGNTAFSAAGSMG